VQGRDSPEFLHSKPKPVALVARADQESENHVFSQTVAAICLKCLFSFEQGCDVFRIFGRRDQPDAIAATPLSAVVAKAKPSSFERLGANRCYRRQPLDTVRKAAS